jgi:hypothetical protein
MKLFSAKRLNVKLLVAFLFLNGVLNLFSAGEIDPAFNASAYGSLVGPVQVFERQPDGKADVAVWRPSTGTWYLLQTTSGFGAVQWGASGDIPTENAFVP